MKQTKSTPARGKVNPSTPSSKKYKVYCTPTFLKEAKTLLKKYPNIKGDFMALKDKLKRDPISDHTPLGQDCYKIRMAISDKGQGESGGARLIIQVRVMDKKVYVLSTYDKSVKDTIVTSTLTKMLQKMGLKK